MSKIAISNEMIIPNNFVFLVYKMNPVTAPLMYKKNQYLQFALNLLEMNGILYFYTTHIQNPIILYYDSNTIFVHLL